MKLRVLDGIAYGIFLAVVVGISVSYVRQETGFYSWDYADYQNYAILVAEAFRNSLGEGWEFIQLSLGQQKNALHTLPILPFLWLGENSRIAYSLGLALVYLVPFCLGLGAIAQELPFPHLHHWGRRSRFWFASFLALLIPMTWVPFLRGYPDLGGATLLIWASWLYLCDPRLHRGRSILGLGLLIGLAILFRRHFAYPALSLLLAAALSQGSLDRKRWRPMLGVWLRLAMVGTVALLLMLAIAPDFTQSALTTDFSSRYERWQLPVSVMLERTGLAYGWGLWGLALLGWLLSQGWPSQRWRFVSWASLLSLGILLFHLRYGNVHYTLHLTPWLVLALLALLNELQRRWRWGIVVLGAYLTVNLSLGLGVSVPTPSLGGLFARSYAPLVREDHEVLQRLLGRLQELSQQQQQIALLAASNHLNTSMFNSEQFQQFPDAPPLTLLPVAIFDGEVSPLEMVLKADVVAVATPAQVIRLEEEQVVRSRSQTQLEYLSQAFSQNCAIAQDFRRLPESFELGRPQGYAPTEKGITVWLYQRQQPTSARVEAVTREQMSELRPCS